jgi:hypothetical protein
MKADSKSRLEREGDEHLLANSARVARRTGLREKDAVRIVSEWQNKQKAVHHGANARANKG